MIPQSLSEHFDNSNKTCLPLLIAFSSLYDINWYRYNMKFYIALRYRYNFNILEKDITMSLQCQYVIGPHHDENLTKNRCRHDIGCPLRY